MKKVKDIMTVDVNTLSPDMPVKEATKRLFELQISGLPVVDSENHVVGMFTEKDILKMILPAYIEEVDGLTQIFGVDALEKKFERADNVKVSEIMRKEVICVDEDLDIAEVAKVMMMKKVRRIPVVKDGKLIGIVSRGDIVKELVKNVRISHEK